LFVQNHCEPLQTLSSLLRKSTKTLTKEVLKTKLKNCNETKITIQLEQHNYNLYTNLL
jgi:hypothetical protein